MRNFYGLVAFVAIGVAACSDGTGPSAAPQFSRQITFPDLQTKLNGLPATGAARAEIELPPTGFVAREVNVEDHEEVDDHESVRGEITALTVSGDNGTLTLAPGFKVTFTSKRNSVVFDREIKVIPIHARQFSFEHDVIFVLVNIDAWAPGSTGDALLVKIAG